MSITIYEDQTGLMLFPDKKKDKDIKIVSFFNNNVDIYIDKVGDNVTIYCHLIAFEASSRPLGYYVIYKNVYSDKVFSNFKRETYDILHTLKIQPRIGHADNIIFENIERFDDNPKSRHKDIEIISKVLELNKRLDYNAGNIDDITIFCRQLLETITRIKIAISTGKSDLGDVNILRNKTHQERLTPTEETKKIFDEQREDVARKFSDENRRIIEEKKRMDGEVGDNKIKEGVVSIKDGLRMKRNAGYINSEIENDINRINNTIADKPAYDTSKYEDTKQKAQIVYRTDKTIVTIVGIIMLISGISIGILEYPSLPNNIKDKISRMVVKEIPVSTTEPTGVITPEPNLTTANSPEPTLIVAKTVSNMAIDKASEINNTINSVHNEINGTTNSSKNNTSSHG